MRSGRVFNKAKKALEKIPAAIVSILTVAAKELPPDEIEIKKDSVTLRYKREF